MDEVKKEDLAKAIAVIQKLDAEWERRKAAGLRSLSESPLDRWLRRRR